ncbi:helix-turn-helix domain-containing protein [Sphingobacterium thalpophilum]|uniref:Uncharacterized protein n=1 Tax=Sphingobacterium thalpophilum TaxID=259 RepID=A0A4U9VEF6_9SPHI|nr:helix-turn-helix domain-containing protein [Sphingobacterium thalpophilum]VTR43532.1 Uncharacterised protein [Sphingobacterium thalpophilum]
MELRTLILLKKKGLSNRKVAQMMNINRKTVDSYIGRFRLLGLDYPELLAAYSGDVDPFPAILTPLILVIWGIFTNSLTILPFFS